MGALSPQQKSALTAVLDELIPAGEDGRMPAASQAGVAEHVLAQVDASPDLAQAVVAGLSALAELLSERGAAELARLAPQDRALLLNALAERSPAFLPGLVFHAYTSYYQHPAVLAGLGVPPRAPHPEGYPMEESDFSLLDPVRARPPMWRAKSSSSASS